MTDTQHTDRDGDNGEDRVCPYCGDPVAEAGRQMHKICRELERADMARDRAKDEPK